MTRQLTVVTKINRGILYIYLTVTATILLLLTLNKITYGPDVTDSLMEIVFLVILGIVFLFQTWAKRTTGLTRLVLLGLTATFMVFMTLYYFLEDGFRVL